VDRDRQVNEFDDETDQLRRKSRANTIDPSLRADNSMFQFPPPKAKKNTSSRAMDVDVEVPLAQAETPQQKRNKRLREGPDDEERGRGSTSSGRSGRRASSLSRGKRISTSYENTGVISESSC